MKKKKQLCNATNNNLFNQNKENKICYLSTKFNTGHAKLT